METEEERKQEERKIKIRAAILTGIFNTALIVAVLYIVAWAPPDPPLPEYGIEVNFGLDDVGSGDIQNKAPANDNESFDKAKPNPPAVEEQVVPTPEPEPEPTPQPTPQPLPEPVEEVVEEAIEEVITPVEAESEVAVEPVQEQPKEEPKPKPEPEKVEQPKPEQPKPEPPKTTEEKTETVNTETVLPSSNGTANEDQANNNGNGDQVGDQGNPQGDLNADALLGSASGGGGAALDMPGWKWDKSPNVVDSSVEVGKVVFEIRIDDEGEVISVKTIYRSVSKGVANVYQQAVLDLTFTPETTAVKPITTGRITFVITSK